MRTVNEYDSVKAEREYINGMPGLQAIGKIEIVRRINGIIRGNIGELLSIAEKMEDPSFYLPIADVSNPQRHDAFLGECERLIHNGLAAAKTRVDLLRTFVARYVEESTPQLASQYQQRIDEQFAGNVSHNFLMGLRNCMLHSRLPVIGTTLHWDRESGIKYILILRTGPLMDDSTLSSDTRKWLGEQGEDLEILAVFSDYYKEVAAFDKWFAASIAKYHLEEIEAYQAAATAFNRRMGLDQRF